MPSLPNQWTGGGPQQLPPRLRQSLCEADDYEHSVPCGCAAPLGTLDALALALCLLGRVLAHALAPPPMWGSWPRLPKGVLSMQLLVARVFPPPGVR